MAESRGKTVLSRSDPHGDGTKVAEYIETPVEKRCGTCEYLVGKNLCRQKVVLKDKEIKTDTKTGLKIIDPKDGCCRFWEEPDKDEDDD
jgi:hypothetical protein